ncbi:tRNA 2-thiocytidine biosynthesis TtcA family protein [Senegalia massiliensis]|uniref:tRNA 2-thiocytidine biosynthesis TtcA family protein n=1 Tax=Senegalia massiliensis TaxID=1720316 RepID=UPI001031AB2A|nr:ATP-binding protein [Senegalia massiliensis]
MDKLAGKGCKQLIPDEDKIPLKDIERNIIKRYRKYLWSPFVKAISNYNLVEEGDKVAIAISGGKDSLLLAKLFQELKKHGNINFEIEFLAMDPGYHEDIKKLLIENCNYLDIPVKIFESKIFEIADEKASEYPCYLCARMRRGALYRKSKELGCNKLALGHHFNDVIETTMLNVLYSGNFKTMLPKLKSQNYEGIELIRPMYYIREDDIERFTETSGIWPLNCACMVAAKKIGNKRYEIKELISQMKENFVDVDKSIFKAAENVNIDRILGYKKDNKKYSFLDFYNE